MADRNSTFDKDRYDACMRQCEYFAERWDSRRASEWKFSVSLWTLLAVGSAFLAGKGHVRWWIICIPTILHFQWLYGVWVANDFDKSMGRKFRDAAQGILMGRDLAEPSPATRPEWYLVLRDWSMLFQLVCTLFLAVALVVLNHIPELQQSR